MADVVAGGVRFHVQRLPAHRPNESCPNESGPNGSGAEQPPTVVFVHGLGVDDMSSFYYTLANPAARAGADVILYDLRGHGATERPATGYSVESSVRDLTALLDALGVKAPIHLIGNSFGGTLALAMAMTHPDRVASLLLIEAVTEPAVMGEEEGYEHLASLLEEGLRLRKVLSDGRVRHDRKVNRIYKAIDALVNGTSFSADLRAQRPFHTAELRSVTCPVSAVYGDKSDILHQGYRLERVLPDCDLTVVPDRGHFLIVEVPDVLCDLMLRWLRAGTGSRLRPVESALAR